MKTNLLNLISIVSDEEVKFSNYGWKLRSLAYNTSIEELNGKTVLVEDYKQDFYKTYNELKRLQKSITKMKKIINNRNHELILPDGRTIQDALIDNITNRRMENYLETLLDRHNRKTRKMESIEPYYECQTLNYDLEKLQAEYDEIKKSLHVTDYEISKLNAIEFNMDT